MIKKLQVKKRLYFISDDYPHCLFYKYERQIWDKKNECFDEVPKEEDGKFSIRNRHIYGELEMNL